MRVRPPFLLGVNRLLLPVVSWEIFYGPRAYRARGARGAGRQDGFAEKCLLKNCRHLTLLPHRLWLYAMLRIPKVISTPQPLLRSAALVFSFATTVFLAADGVLSKVVSSSVWQ